MGPLKLHTEIESWPLKTPFRISGYTFIAIEMLVVGLEKDGHTGRGEAAGVYYRKETATSMREQIEALRPKIEAGVTREALQQLLPPGGARNALDCAHWDLQAKLEGTPVWKLAGIDQPRPLLTTFTCGADEPEKMAEAAWAYTGARAIKLKLVGDAIDADRIRAVRAVLPDVWLGIDANQGFTRDQLEKLMPVLLGARVSLIEQPFPIGQDAQLDGFQSPIPVAADESVQSRAEIPSLLGRFSVINIKLDKCGGVTEALQMVRSAKSAGLDIMVGNMMGTSLAMAPAFLVGQLCSVVDLDGVVFLKQDRSNGIRYSDGLISCPETVWGR